jgi:hypothetical protein
VARIDGAEDPSTAARGNLLRVIGRCTGCSPEAFSIVKDHEGPGAPGLSFRGLPLAVEFSLSHDGRFSAFAFDPITLISAIGTARAKF